MVYNNRPNNFTSKFQTILLLQTLQLQSPIPNPQLPPTTTSAWCCHRPNFYRHLTLRPIRLDFSIRHWKEVELSPVVWACWRRWSCSSTDYLSLDVVKMEIVGVLNWIRTLWLIELNWKSSTNNTLGIQTHEHFWIYVMISCSHRLMYHNRRYTKFHASTGHGSTPPTTSCLFKHLKQ